MKKIFFSTCLKDWIWVSAAHSPGEGRSNMNWLSQRTHTGQHSLKNNCPINSCTRHSLATRQTWGRESWLVEQGAQDKGLSQQKHQLLCSSIERYSCIWREDWAGVQGRNLQVRTKAELKSVSRGRLLTDLVLLVFSAILPISSQPV